LDHVFVGGIEQVIPGCGRFQVILFEKLIVAHENEGIIGNAHPVSVGVLETGGYNIKSGGFIRFEDPLLDSGDMGFHRAAEEDIHAGVTLLGDDPGQGLAGGKTDEVHVNPGGLLKFLEHGPGPVLRPDGIGIQAFRGEGLGG